MPERDLTATIVTFHPDAQVLARTVRSLAVAIDRARSAQLVSDSRLFIVDNGDAASLAAVQRALGEWPAAAGTIEVISGQGNVGYGRANNLVLDRLGSQYHLIINPDVELAPDALCAALCAMRDHAGFGLVAPAVYGDDGARQYLCKRYPSVWVLFLRGFAPAALRARFSKTLDDYEMRDVIADRLVPGIPLASGCFMLVRTGLFERLGGFDPRFFLYFEDYDLSLRIGREAQVAYVPQARIVHHGGEAARKGWRHVAWFLRSAWRFFAIHGWKFA